MRIRAKDIIGILILVVAIGGALVMVFSGSEKASAEAVPPSQVLLHQNAIIAAQRSNEIHIPLLEDEQRIVNANNDTADSSRRIICRNFPDYCSQEFLNPLEASVDLDRYLLFQ